MRRRRVDLVESWPDVSSVTYSPPAGRFAIVVGAVQRAGDRVAPGRLPRHVRLATACPTDRIDVAWVPGSFEIPLVARKLAASGRYAAVICLGCVIRGETAHFDHVAGQAAAGVMQAGLATGVPVIFGILTTDSVEQALESRRAQGGEQGGRRRHGGDRDGQPDLPTQALSPPVGRSGFPA